MAGAEGASVAAGPVVRDGNGIRGRPPASEEVYAWSVSQDRRRGVDGREVLSASSGEGSRALLVGESPGAEIAVVPTRANRRRGPRGVASARGNFHRGASFRERRLLGVFSRGAARHHHYCPPCPPLSAATGRPGDWTSSSGSRAERSAARARRAARCSLARLASSPDRTEREGVPVTIPVEGVVLRPSSLVCSQKCLRAFN